MIRHTVRESMKPRSVSSIILSHHSLSLILISMSPGSSHSYHPPDRSAQNLNVQTLVSILNSTKSTEVPNVLRSLSPDAQDTLMKYFYKGMAVPGWGDVSGSASPGWHEKVCCTFTPPLHRLFSRPLLTNFMGDSSLLYWDRQNRMYCQGYDRQKGLYE